MASATNKRQIYQNIPSLYETTELYKGSNVISMTKSTWYRQEDNDTFQKNAYASNGSNLFTLEETLIHFGSIVCFIFVTTIIISIFTLIILEIKNRLHTERFMSTLKVYVYKSWVRSAVNDCNDGVANNVNKMKNTSNFSGVPLVVPKHVAIIMDGNRRYGETQLGSKSKGHTKGGETLGNCIKWCQECGVEVLTVYAFSTENWKRDEKEVKFLMETFKTYANEILVKALKNNIRVNVLASEPKLLPLHIRKLFKEIGRKTINNTSFTLNLCVSYGGRSEIVQATKRIANDFKNGKIKSVNDIDEKLYENYLLTNMCKTTSVMGKNKKGEDDNTCSIINSCNRSIDNNPDLLIRTSGECRLSNFLLYQLAYSEMIFLDKHWPEFSKKDLIDCVNIFSNRKRRYGK
eukprot:g5578.t1